MLCCWRTSFGCIGKFSEENRPSSMGCRMLSSTDTSHSISFCSLKQRLSHFWSQIAGSRFQILTARLWCGVEIVSWLTNADSVQADKQRGRIAIVLEIANILKASLLDAHVAIEVSRRVARALVCNTGESYIWVAHGRTWTDLVDASLSF